MMVLLEWACTVLSLLGTYGIAQHFRAGWWLCVGADVGFCVYSYRGKKWGFFTLCFAYTIVNVIGGLK